MILFSFSQNILGETPPVTLENGKESYEIGLNLDFLEDPEGKLTINDIIKKKWVSKFKRSKKKVSNFGFSKSAFWVRFVIRNNSNEESWFVSQSSVNTERINFYKKINDKWESISTGTKKNFKTRELEDKGFLFKIRPGNKTIYFLRVKSSLPVIDLNIYSSSFLIKKRSRENLISGLFFGLVITIFLYNLFIFISTKNFSNLFYFLFVLFWGGGLFNLQGFFQRFIAPDSTWISAEGRIFIMAFAMIFLILFTINYLKLNKEHPNLLKFSLVLISLNLLRILSLLVFPQSLNIKLAWLFILVTIPAILFLGIFRWKMDYRPAKYYVIAFSFLTVGICISILAALRFLPVNLFTSQSVYIGSAFQLIFLSMGLADRIQVIQENLLESERQKSGLLEELTVEVNKTVDEKRKTLNTLIENIDEGFFIFDKNGVIQPGATQSSVSLFETDLENKKMEEVLKLNRLEKKKFNKWLNHVFKAFVPFKDLSKLAPKRFIINEEKIIGLDYKPILNKENKSEISQIICIANDITEKVYLEKKAQKEKEKALSLTSVLDNSIEFIDLISDSEETINYYLKNLRSSKPEDVFRSFHTLKARFGNFKINAVVQEIHSLEGFLNEVEDNWESKNISLAHIHIEKINIARTDFLKENRRLVELVNSSNNGKGNIGSSSYLIKKIQNAFLEFNKEFILKEVSTLFHQFISPINELARQQDKLVDIKIHESKIYLSPERYSDFLASLLHVFRNSIDHGTETREERISKNKSEIANIDISFSKKDEKVFKIKIKDDGKGIDPEKIRSIANQKEKFKNLNFSKMKEEEIIALIVEPGFSSKEEVNTISGRGIGMDVVKSETEKLGGEISVESKIDEGTTMLIKLPIIV